MDWSIDEARAIVDDPGWVRQMICCVESCLFSYLRLRFIGHRVKRYRLQTFAYPVDLIPPAKATAAEGFFLSVNTEGRDVVGIEGYRRAACSA